MLFALKWKILGASMVLGIVAKFAGSEVPFITIVLTAFLALFLLAFIAVVVKARAVDKEDEQ